MGRISPKVEEMPGWKGNIDRIETEKKLEHQRLGTYVLRHAGKMTQLLSSNLSETNKMIVEAYLVTIKDIDKKIAEQLILHTDRGWTIYRDNPDLNDTKYYLYFKTFQEALKHLEPRAQTPLRN